MNRRSFFKAALLAIASPLTKYLPTTGLPAHIATYVTLLNQYDADRPASMILLDLEKLAMLEPNQWHVVYGDGRAVTFARTEQ